MIPNVEVGSSIRQLSLRHDLMRQQAISGIMPLNESETLILDTDGPVTKLSNQEKSMADLNNSDAVSNEASIDATGAASTPKKTRKPRTPKVATSDAIASEVPSKKPRAKRGSKATAETTAKPGRRKQVRNVPSAPQEATVVATSTGQHDDIASLVQLEEENKSLRKQLFEKLNAENADLRKRLGQG